MVCQGVLLQAGKVSGRRCHIDYVVLVSRCGHDMILLTLFHRIAGGWIFYTVIVPVLLAVPFLFCRFRYTAKRQDEIFARHSRKKTGRRLLAIWAAIVGIFCLEVLLMVLSGLWSIESHP